MSLKTHEHFMRLAIAEALKGEGKTSPNPMVGAVVVWEGEVIGKGFHAYAGGPHAEVAAIEDVLAKRGGVPHGSKLYVTLEPCSHYGRTPPCTKAINAWPFSDVIVGCQDPNPQVTGRGIEFLKQAGLQVEQEILKQECLEVIKVFDCNMRNRRPYFSLKMATTIDGFIADQHSFSKWISNEQSREHVHLLRSKVDALLIGIKSILADDPQLNTRLKNETYRQKLIVLDPHLRMPMRAKCLHSNGFDSVTLVVSEQFQENPLVEEWRSRGTEVIFCELSDSGFHLLRLSQELYRRGFGHVLVEGGACVFSSFFEAKLVDQYLLFQAPKVLGAGFPHLHALATFKVSELKTAMSFKLHKIETFDSDLLCDYRRV